MENSKAKGVAAGLGAVGTAGVLTAILRKKNRETKQDDICVRSIEQVNPEDVGFEDYGHLKHFEIDKDAKKKVLITGAGSYIGESFKTYCKEHYPNIDCSTVDMLDGSWREKSFVGYDTVFHVAGIAHADVGHTSKEEQELYYKVNTDLAIETAEKAKADGVKQFIFMSSMIIYGGKEYIDDKTLPEPKNFYGNSKWLADKEVRKLSDDSFNVAVLRSPMIYGKGSKGNYQTLRKIAKKAPIFPDVDNKRSMLCIENLCEFVCELICSESGGIFFPQNSEYSNTSRMVSDIAEAASRDIKLSSSLSPLVSLFEMIPGKVNQMAEKAFGSSYYDVKLSKYDGIDYQVLGLHESIKRTELRNKKKKKHILLISQYFHPETFRVNDMADEWVKRGYRVTVLTGIPNYPMGKFYEGYDYTHKRKEKWEGVEIIRIPLVPRGNSGKKILNYFGMTANYFSFVLSGFLWVESKGIQADMVYTYEVSPMTQALVGCLYRKKYKVPHFLYVTDLWPENVESVTGVHTRFLIHPIQCMVDYIYKNTDYIFTCSKSFIPKIEARGVSNSRIEFWPQYAEEFYKPLVAKDELIPQDKVINLVFTGSVGFAQGLGILVDTAKKLKHRSVLVRFSIIGDGRYLDILKEDIKVSSVEDYFNFIPRQKAEDIPKYIACADAQLITLSKNDVFAITLPAKTQSCFACGKPILVSADGEIQDIVNEAGAGLCSNAEDVSGLENNIIRFMNMSLDERIRLGENALYYAKTHFDKTKQMDRLDKVFKEYLKNEVGEEQ